MIIAGAAVLIVLSVVITAVLVNRAPSPVVAAAAPAIAKPAPPDLDAPPPIIVAPPLALPAAADGSRTAAVTSDSPSVVGGASIVPGTTRTSTNAPASDSGTAVSLPPVPGTSGLPVPALGATAAPDPRIIAFVDQIRVTGIRSSGDDSKVLMNDRVYRVNDIVERILNIRLTKIAPEGLTFEDANGVTYTKNF